MKRKTYMSIGIVLVVGMILFLGSKIYEQKQKQNFEIKRTIVISSADFERSYIRVVVYEKDYEIDKMFQEIIKEYNMLNGESDELVISIYNSREDLVNGDYVDG